LEDLADMVSIETAVAEPERDYTVFLAKMGLDVLFGD
jgi:hypothetical protein